MSQDDADNTQVLALAASRPPRCLSKFRVRRSHRIPELPDMENIGEPSYLHYSLACPCGSPLFAVAGWRNPSEGNQSRLQPPIVMECPRCSLAIPLFNPRTDGYDALTGGLPFMGKYPADGHQRSSPEGLFAPCVMVEYCQTDDELSDYPEFAANAADYFTWFTLYGQREGAEGVDQVLFDWECA